MPQLIIDIQVAEFTTEMFRIGERILTPDILYKEKLADRHPELRDLGLFVEELTSLEVAEVERLRASYRTPSTNDLFALSLAKSRGWLLLSGDASLRDASEKESTEVHGTLWLIERMVQRQVITSPRALIGFKMMRKHGRRLPWTEVEALMARLNGRQPNRIR